MRSVIHTWRHLSTRIVVALSAALPFSCSDGGSLHAPSYDGLVARIESCDTADIAKDIAALRASTKPNSATAQTDADALAARFFLLKGDYSSATSFADYAVAKVAARADSASCGSLKFMAEMRCIEAEALRRNDFTTEAITAAERGAALALRASACPELVDLTLVNSVLRRDLCDHKGCLAELRKAETIIDTASLSAFSPSERIRSLTRASQVATDMCHMGAATRLLTKASEYFDKASDKDKIDYLCQLTRLHIVIGEVGKASSALSRAETLMDKSKLNYARPYVQAYQSLVKSRSGDYEWAKFVLGKCSSDKMNEEERFIAMMSLTEILCNDGRMNQAKAVIQDSVHIYDSSIPYLQVIYNDTKLILAQKEGDYKTALDIQTFERRKLITSYNDLFAYDDYRRCAELTEALNDRHSDELDDLTSTATTRTTVLALLLLAALAALAFLWRKLHIATASNLSDKERRDYNQKLIELRRQADMLEVANERITEGIAYAEQIQHTISPSPEGLNAFPISGSFVFFSPLDVVSGDFFWYTNRGNKLIICCADCTGHGVPGALLSMMSVTLLNNICANVKDDEVDPGDILERLDGMLVDNLARNRELDAKDGMDAALVVLDLVTHNVKSASARRPVVFVHNGELVTIRGSKRSIGDVEPIVRQRRFETYTVDLQKGDKIYMYTDGYSDQFGGQNGEKLKNTMVERFLTKISDDDMEQQSLAIQEMFIQWKGDFPQTDDVTFVGLSV